MIEQGNEQVLQRFYWLLTVVFQYNTHNGKILTDLMLC